MVFTDSSEITIAIRNAVRHLQELSESFENSKFTSEDLSNVDYVADTLSALEKEILKLYTDYETESIDSSRLRHRLKLLPITIKNEIQTAVLMARESNVSVIQTLQRELDSQLELVQRYTDQDTQLNKAISSLQAEKNALQNQYDATIHEVNKRLSEKATLQINLNETRDTVRETNEHTYDLEEEMMNLKERLMQERNDARQEKGRLEDDYGNTLKRYDGQERMNQVLKKDVDLATHQVSESELQLRSMYRERERFENENKEIQAKFEEQNQLFEMEQREHDRLLREQLEFTEHCGIALMNYQTKKSALEERGAVAQERTNEETENLRALKLKHDNILKEIEEESTAAKTLEGTITDTGKELEELKQDIAGKLEKTAQLNLENAETSAELDAMREAHQMMTDSLKLQINSLDRELQLIRDQRVEKQKEREAMLKTIEQTKLTSRNNDIRHNRFVTQTTTRVNDLSERKVILDRNLREDQTQMKQLDEQLSTLKVEYRQMKTKFEEQIKYLEETTAQLLTTIEKNRKKVVEESPDFERLQAKHTEVTRHYETTKEIMIDTKRKKQDVLDKIAGIQRNIREKNRSRDVAMVAVKQCQNETQQRIQRASEELMLMEEDIYDKGCRLETLEHENERFEKTIEYLRYQIDLFNRFSQQSNIDIKQLDENNGQLQETLESGWQDDRQLENQAAAQDLAYIDDLTLLLQHTEQRKTKVGTVVYRLIGELQQLKHYLQGMSTPSTPATANPTTPNPIRRRRRRPRRRSESQERVHSASTNTSSRLDATPTQERPQSAARADLSVNTNAWVLSKDVQERVSNFVENNFPLRVQSGGKKSTKSLQTVPSGASRSARTDYSSLKSMHTNSSTPEPEFNRKQASSTTPKVAFA